MKKMQFRLIVAAVALIAGVTLAFLFAGCSSAPTKVEQGLFNIRTNTFEIVVTRTNVVPVWQTNLVVREEVRTNVVASGPPVVEVVRVTNQTFVVNYQTNTVVLTNKLEDYQYTPGDKAKAIAETGGAVGQLFGVGGLVATGISALFGVWAQMRSRKRYWTAASLAQTIESLRVFVKQLPNGAAYDAAFVQWMQTHQVDANVMQQVLELLRTQVDNGEARETVEAIQKLVDGMRQGATLPA